MVDDAADKGRGRDRLYTKVNKCLYGYEAARKDHV